MVSGAHVYTFTKDNPTCLAALLADIDRVAKLLDIAFTITIVDDSVSVAARKEISRLAAEALAEVGILRRDEQQSLHESAFGSLSFRRPLGEPGFDVATCRNTAFLHFMSTWPDSPYPVLLFDSDICLSSWTFDRQTYHVDGAAAVAAMLEAVGSAPHTIAGSPLIGRADFSFFEHLDYHLGLAISSRELADHLKAGMVPPATGGRNVAGLGQLLGISGGALCLSVEAVKQAPMMYTYNEDIIWLAFLEHRGFRRVRTSEPLIHADSKMLRIDGTVVRGQGIGEALWDLVNEVGWPPLGSEVRSDAWRDACRGIADWLMALSEQVSRFMLPFTGQSMPGLAMLLHKEAEWMASHSVVSYQEVLNTYNRDIEQWQTAWKRG